eukprot:CAMPEP_0180278654 /NCGR_PEP_ID=MMETSP0988-20121125/7604_1 /TAXON_ID=697907 /ORGANISM="non described non described, Strain CCMP2293" /LENGTH=167 /DNA_ID=CAMNT_0022250227 /DNA_START=435 /DNA_END=935 /DNA_ORIENTATION=+
MAFLQTQFQCPPMLGARRTLRGIPSESARAARRHQLRFHHVRLGWRVLFDEGFEGGGVDAVEAMHLPAVPVHEKKRLRAFHVWFQGVDLVRVGHHELELRSFLFDQLPVELLHHIDYRGAWPAPPRVHLHAGQALVAAGLLELLLRGDLGVHLFPVLSKREIPHGVA